MITYFFLDFEKIIQRYCFGKVFYLVFAIKGDLC